MTVAAGRVLVTILVPIQVDEDQDRDAVKPGSHGYPPGVLTRPNLAA